jgi:hypothetical protein
MNRGDGSRRATAAAPERIAVPVEQAMTGQLGNPRPFGFPQIGIGGHLVQHDRGRVVTFQPRGQVPITGPEPAGAAGAAMPAKAGLNALDGAADVNGLFVLIDKRVDQAASYTIT